MNIRHSYLLPFICLLAAVLAQPSSAANTFPPRDKFATRDEYLVRDLPGLSKLDDADRPLMYAGQLELYPQNHTEYFFWKFLDEASPKTQLIFWLNGGPGCSSLDGALMESGPLRVNHLREVIANNGSWHRKADIVYVDQPGGTGFSVTEAWDRELSEVTFDFMVFLQRYFAVFPEDMNKEIYIAGESYAGQYIPYIAQGILRRNLQKKVNDPEYKLKGVMIGNGWIDPNQQSLSYLPFAMERKLLDVQNHGYRKLLEQQEMCQNRISHATGDEKELLSFDECEVILSYLFHMTLDHSAPKDQQCLNMYDMRLKDSYPSCGMNWPPDLTDIYPFLATEGVMALLNIHHTKKWTECDPTVSRYLRGKKSRPSVHLLPGLLLQIEVLLFFGDSDVICNIMGGEKMVLDMRWGGAVKNGFSEASEYVEWLDDDKSAGRIRLERNLTFVQVYNASHMVPFDKPLVSRSLVDLMFGNVKNAEMDGTKVIKTSPISTGDKPEEGPEHSPGASDEKEDTQTQQPSSSFYREYMIDILELTVIFIIVWALLYLYNKFTTRPSSILTNQNSQPGLHNSRAGPYGKPGSSQSAQSGAILGSSRGHKKKKSVQWVDQVVNFDDIVRSKQKNIFKKVLTKMGVSDTLTKALYLPLENSLANEPDWDIELGLISEEPLDFEGGSSSQP
ncbi:hypothetical protein BABINDRAFT_159205 [Babjeviella inositovora NRRL Y-12698]|uniref:Carboxypeptidase n=1 Tax=Babjeviella inositovora NRRL Y-12698 TaxID=984486 RepID=A0A1E3QYP3_9ASCO|nr:uncharacterized protein BABINDRAFT_159205 [Babjeviella inositovora NRRL Y-12698]ODQ82674.1 hypothetical protein BABINDRAFT_159205 [Babjeviella inositovora NRRL Y-12698]